MFGENAVLTVPAVKDAANLRRYLREGPHAGGGATSFFRAVRRLGVSTTFVVLVEGSAYMDAWTCGPAPGHLGRPGVRPRRQALPRRTP